MKFEILFLRFETLNITKVSENFKTLGLRATMLFQVLVNKKHPTRGKNTASVICLIIIILNLIGICIYQNFMAIRIEKIQSFEQFTVIL